MKTKTILCAAAMAALAAGGAQAQEDAVPAKIVSDFATTAKVAYSTPIIETVVEPVEECRYENRRVGSRGASDNKGDRIVGGILGGAAGSAFGGGRGKDAAAAVGAVLGSEIGAQDGELSGGELLGGVAGGVIGNQVGSGSGRTTATAAGALLGALVGDELQNGQQRRDRAAANAKYKEVRVCTFAEREKKVITGYEVVYEYSGRRFVGVLPYRPGETVDIQVSPELIENRTTRADTVGN